MGGGGGGLGSDIIWSKPNPMPESVTDRPTKAHEYIFLLSKSANYFYDAEAIKEPQVEDERRRRLREQEQGLNTRYDIKRDQHEIGQTPQGSSGMNRSVAARHRLAVLGTRNRRSVWTVATAPYPEAHFATFPEALVTPCILAGCPVDGFVLDPMCGSGTVESVAYKLGRKGIGMDLKPEYNVLAMKRARQTPMGLPLLSTNSP